MTLEWSVASRLAASQSHSCMCVFFALQTRTVKYRGFVVLEIVAFAMRNDIIYHVQGTGEYSLFIHFPLSPGQRSSNYFDILFVLSKIRKHVCDHERQG